MPESPAPSDGPGQRDAAPDEADEAVAAMCQLARTLHAMGRYQDALQAHDLVLTTRPGHLEALNNRGVALQALGRLEEALASFDRALELKPDYIEALNNRGAVLKTLGRMRDALVSLDRAIGLRSWPPALNNRANVLRELGRAQEALADHDLALEAAPGLVEALADRGLTLWRLGRLAEALESFDAALEANPRQSQVLNNRGLLLLELKQPQRALASYEQALALAPDYVDALANRAMLLTELGRLDDARASIERALQISPGNARVHYIRALGAAATPDSEALAALLRMAETADRLSASDQVHVHYALAKMLEDIGDTTGAWAHLQAGSALKRRLLAYDETAALTFFEGVRSAFNPEVLSRRWSGGWLSQAPVFVVGMPRSGTTLVEQILTSHPAISTVGETDFLAMALQRHGPPTTELAGWSDWISRVSAEALTEIGEDYLGQVMAAAPASAARVIDKGLSNFHLLGLIRLVLPEARIIHVQRDPLDTCLSCHSKLFAEDLAFTYDLGELGRYYAAYERLMDHWRAALPPGMMIEVRYEALVDDLEREARRLVAHCGLEWDPACLRFQEQERWVHTASAVQVRRPIYRTSMGRWKAYEPHLGELMAALGGAGRKPA